MLTTVKAALRITTSIYDSVLTMLINAALADLGIVGIDINLLDATSTDPLIVMAVVTYCRLNFGTPDDYDKMKASYDEQKAQMMTATGYGL